MPQQFNYPVGPPGRFRRTKQTSFVVPARSRKIFTISGVTRDASGNVLGGATVDLFTTNLDVKFESVVSDPVTGTFSFSIPDSQQYYLVAYLAGSPDRGGVSVNTLVGS